MSTIEPKNKFILILTSLFLAIFGFFDATYLTIIHYKNIIPPCSLAHGCETVLTSQYSMIGPIPLALIGTGYFLLIIILLGLKLQMESKLLNKIILILTSLSLIISIILVGLQAFVIHAFCQWCLTTEAINVILFILSLSLNFNTKE